MALRRRDNGTGLPEGLDGKVEKLALRDWKVDSIRQLTHALIWYAEFGQDPELAKMVLEKQGITKGWRADFLRGMEN